MSPMWLSPFRYRHWLGSTLIRKASSLHLCNLKRLCSSQRNSRGIMKRTCALLSTLGQHLTALGFSVLRNPWKRRKESKLWLTLHSTTWQGWFTAWLSQAMKSVDSSLWICTYSTWMVSHSIKVATWDRNWRRGHILRGQSDEWRCLSWSSLTVTPRILTLRISHRQAR